MRPWLRLFGVPALVIDDAPVRLAAAPKALAMLGIIAANGGAAIMRAQLAAMLYPDRTDEEARLSARRHLHELTKCLPEGAFEVTKNTIALALETDIDRPPETTAGEYCAGVFDEALEPIRERLRQRWRAALEERARALRAADRLSESAAFWEQLLTDDPLDESAARELMQLRIQQGDRTAALLVYNRLANYTRSELGVEPEHETTRLFQSIALGAGDRVAIPNNLPVTSSTFVGRDRELRDLYGALDENAVVTIVGAPGIGKTRLAIRAAVEALERFKDGVWFVDLTPLRSAAQVYEQFAVVVGTPQDGERRPDVRAAIAGKTLLVVLDNCEHLVEAAAELAREIARESSCRVLATSRKRLPIENEFVLPLEPLDTPAASDRRADEVKRSAAARLFFERAVTVSPALRLTDENAQAAATLVRRLEGIPLALEIVAARANLLTIDGMLKRLHETGTRSPLDKALLWSWELLSPQEARLLAQLAIFSGSWTIEAAEHVAATDDTFSTLSELVESSLVHSQRREDAVRYSLLETTKAFARDRLAELDAHDEAARRHAEFYCALAESFAPHFRTTEEIAFYRRCDDEFDNLRAGMDWAAAHDPLLAARYVRALWRYCIFRWRIGYAQAAIAHALAHAGCLPMETLAHVHLAAGMIAKEQMQYEPARAHVLEARALFSALGDVEGESDAVNALALATFNHNDITGARDLFLAAAQLQERLGDVKALSGTIANLAAIAQINNDDEAALGYLERALGGFQATNHQRGIAYAYRAMAHSLNELGRVQESVEYARRSVQVYKELGDVSRLADGFLTLGNALLDAGALAEALDAFAQALDVLQRADHPLFIALALLGYAQGAEQAGDPLESVKAVSSAFFFAEERGMTITERYRERIMRSLDRSRSALGRARYDAAWAAGKRLSPLSFAKNAAILAANLAGSCGLTED